MKTSPGLVCVTCGMCLVVFLFQTRDRGRLPERISAHNANSQPTAVENFAKVPLAFEPNQGQAGPRVKFLSRRGRFSAFLTVDDAVVALQEPEASDTGKPRRRSMSFRPTTTTASKSKPAMFEMKLVGANPNAQIEGVDELPGRSNYFIGNDPKKWHTNVANYSKVRYRDVYKGVDLYFYGHEQRLEYDFVLAPGADPSLIQLKFDGAKNLKIDANGDLVLDLGAEEVSFHKPLVYQATEGGTGTDAVDSKFVISQGNRVSFSVSAYDITGPLIIDPVLSYGTYLNSGQQARGIAIDSLGDVYALWFLNGSIKVVNITKLDPTGSTLLYSTSIGGSGADYPWGIVVDSSGSAYITGSTSSSDFPTTAGAFQTTLKATGPSMANTPPANGFVTKLDPSGSSLVYSTYLGGSKSDQATGIVLDSDKNAYITGSASSADFPVTAGAFQGTLHGASNAFVTKLNNTGTAPLLYSTFLGGSGSDSAIGIGLDSAKNIYIAGSTSSSDFPLTSALQSTPGDMFMAKFNTTGTLAYSTYFAGTGDGPSNLAVDSAGNAYLGGYTFSSAFPTTPGAFQPTVTLTPSELTGFLLKLNPAGSALVYSTYLGGAGNRVFGLAVDSTGQAYASLYATLQPPLVPVNPIASTLGGSLVELNPPGSATPFATPFFVAGPIAVDPSGNLYIAATTDSTAPATVGAYQTDSAGYTGKFGFWNFWVGKISPANGASIALAPFSLTFNNTQVGQTSGSTTSVSVNNVGSTPLNITGINFAGDFSLENSSCSSLPAASNCAISVNFSPTATGTRTGSMTIDYNDGAAKTVMVSLTGSGFNPPLAINATSGTDFGYVLVGKTSASLTIMVQNLGDTVAVAGVTISGDFQQTNTCGSSIPTNASCNIAVTFAPTAAGARTGTLTITADAQGSPYTIPMTGNGFTGGLGVAAPSTLTFGTQSVGTTSAAQTVTLTNTGTASINVTGVSPSGEFAETNNCGSTLAPNANCTASVTFSPKAAGTRTGTISFFDSSPNAPQIVQLTGTAIDWSLSVPSSGMMSQTVTAGQSATYQVNVASTGFMGTVALSCNDPASMSMCSLSNPSVTFTGSGSVPVSVSVTTTARSGGLFGIGDRRMFPPYPAAQAVWVLWAAIALSCCAMRFRGQLRRWRVAFGCAAFAFIVLMGLAACGGSGSSSSNPPPTNIGTPAGTYTVVVNATAQSATQNLNLQIVVQ